MHSTEEREYNVAREYYVELVYWFHRGVKFYMKQRQNDMDKISVKDDTKCNNFILLYVR